MLFVAMHDSGSGTARLFWDVRSHVGLQRWGGNVAGGPNSTILTERGPPTNGHLDRALPPIGGIACR
jgi:hypothetical protein